MMQKLDYRKNKHILIPSVINDRARIQVIPKEAFDRVNLGRMFVHMLYDPAPACFTDSPIGFNTHAQRRHKHPIFGPSRSVGPEHSDLSHVHGRVLTVYMHCDIKSVDSTESGHIAT